MKRILAIILTSTYFLSAALHAQASDTGSIAQDIHNQLAYSNSATVYVDDIELDEVIARATAIDDKNNPYDADMLLYRAPHFTYTLYNTGKLELKLEGAFSIEESEKLLDKMEQEIRANLDTDNQKEELKAIIKYITDTYEYDSETFNIRKDNKDVQYINYVEAYNGNRRIACGQYAALTYLLCNRFGIDCKVVHGNNHLYNIIRLDGQNSYTAYDLTKVEHFLPAKVDFIDLITFGYTNIGTSKLDKIENEINKITLDGINYHYSFTAESIIFAILVLGVIALYIRRDSYKRPKKRHSKARKVATRRK